jgi:subtilisin family serine protease
MKNLRFKLLALLCAFTIVQSCNDPIVDEQIVGDSLELKSATLEKKGYIVVLNDVELDAELSKLKGYEKKQAAVKSKTQKILERAGISDGEVEHVYGTVFKGFSVKIAPGQLKKLNNDPSVSRITEDRVISLGKPSTNEVSASSTQSIPWGIPRVNGIENYSGSNRAWIVDSGIDLDHPDLNVNQTLSKTFIVGGKPTTPDDEHGHGTHVAGTVAARNNDFGVIGVAPGAQVVSCRVLDRRGSGSFSWTVAALDYIATEGIGQAGDVVNMSLGPNSRYTDDAVDAAVQAVAAKGILISIAAGNESDDCSFYSPAHNNGTNIYTISAMDINENFASFSNYGSPVDFCEPGVNILSTYKGGSYGTMSGTSMAAPHAAGILLAGNIKTDGYVSGDPDGDADPIGVLDGNVTTPTNQAPTADFTYSVSNLSVQFTDASSDADGTIASYAWNFGDTNTSTAKNPSHTYSAADTYTVTLTVTDDDGATDSYSSSVTVTDDTSGEGITLTATSRKVRGIRYVDLTWSGASGTNVDIKINGVTEKTTANDGSDTLNLGRESGTFVFSVCETNSSVCSN